MNINYNDESDKIITQLANKIVEITPVDPTKAFLPRNAERERIKLTIQHEYNKFRNRVSNAVLILKETFDAKLTENSEQFSQLIIDEMATLKVGLRVKDLYRLSKDTQKVFIATAESMFTNQQYNDASDILCILCLINPENDESWAALGNAEYHCKRFDEAISAYTASLALGSEDPYLFLYIAHCFEEKEQMDDAIALTENSLSIVLDDFEGYREWSDTASGYLEYLKERMVKRD